MVSSFSFIAFETGFSFTNNLKINITASFSIINPVITKPIIGIACKNATPNTFKAPANASTFTFANIKALL